MSGPLARAAQALALLGLLLSPLAAAGGNGPALHSPLLPQLLSRLAARSAATAHFEQTQYLSILTRPLQSEGELIYRAPDFLEERIVRPRPQRLVMDRGVLTLQLGRHHRSVPLRDYPQLAPLLESVRATLAGDASSLERLFDVSASGTLAAWTLQLTPRAGQVPGPLRSIELQGQQAQIRQVRIQQRNGDHAVMRIDPSS